MFFANKFRISQPCDFATGINTFLSLNFKKDSNKECSGIINELQQTREIIGNFSNRDCSPEQINNNIQLCFSYINALENFQSKVSFSNESSSIRIPFSWKETSILQTTTSYNIYYEICSVKFNLAVLFCLIGYTKFKKKDCDILKEGVKAFEKAAFYFSEVKELVYSQKVVYDKIPDFMDSYIESCANFSLGMAQMCVLSIAEIKGMNKQLLSKLSIAVSMFFSRIYKTTFTYNTDKDLVKYYTFFYEAKAFHLNGMHHYEIADSTGKGYGVVIPYLQKAEDGLNECTKICMKVKNFVDYNGYAQLLEDNSKLLKRLENDNKNVYREKVLSKTQVTIPESAIKVKATEHKDKIKEFEFLWQINNLLSKDLQPIINSYIQQMLQFLNSEVKKYENEETINNYLQNNNLPQILTMGISISSISDTTYQNLQNIKNLGGLDYLTNQLSLIETQRNKVFTYANEIHQKLILDKEIDSKNQLLYGNDWKTGNNPSYENQCIQFIQAINKAKEIDIKTNVQIAQNVKYYELVGLPKHVIEANIPRTANCEHIKKLNSYQPLNDAYKKLIQDKKELLFIVDKLKAYIQMNIPTNDLLNVLKRIKSEMFVITDNKKILTKKMEELGAMSDVIKKDYEVINAKIEEYKKECSAVVTIVKNEETNIYLQHIENAGQAFQKDVDSIKEGLKFYTNCESKLKKLDEEILSYLAVREMERDELIEKLTSIGRYNIAH